MYAIHCHMHASSTSRCPLVYKHELEQQKDDFTELLAMQHEKLTNEDMMESETERNDEERQQEEEVTEETNRFTVQEMARFSLFEEALLVSEAQDPNVAAAIQNANPVQLCHLLRDKKSYYPDTTGSFFQEDR